MGGGLRDLPVGSMARLLFRVGRALGGFAGARRKAMKGFRRGLMEMGVPADAAAELTRVYPRVSLKDLGLAGRHGDEDEAPEA